MGSRTDSTHGCRHGSGTAAAPAAAMGGIFGFGEQPAPSARASRNAGSGLSGSGSGNASFGFGFGASAAEPHDSPPAGPADASAPAADAMEWVAGGGLAVGGASAQSFMRQAPEEELREAWVRGRRDARAAFKKRHLDSARQQRLRSRGSLGGKKR